jgi:hypothetical protein
MRKFSYSRLAPSRRSSTVDPDEAEDTLPACEYTHLSVFDLRCDDCGTYLIGPGDDEDPAGPFGIRFLYHPGDFLMKDDSGLLCQTCWSRARTWLGEERPENRCAVCGETVEHSRSLHVHRSGDPAGWQLCRVHAVEFLNRLRTVEPKLEAQTFTLAGDWRERQRGGS